MFYIIISKGVFRHENNYLAPFCEARRSRATLDTQPGSFHVCLVTPQKGPFFEYSSSHVDPCGLVLYVCLLLSLHKHIINV